MPIVRRTDSEFAVVTLPPGVCVLADQRIANCRHVHLICRKAVCIDPDIDCAAKPTLERHIADSLRPLDLGFHQLVGDLGKFT